MQLAAEKLDSSTVEMYIDVFKNRDDSLYLFLKENNNGHSPLLFLLEKINSPAAAKKISIYINALKDSPSPKIFTLVNNNQENLLHLFLRAKLSSTDFRTYLQALKKYPSIISQVFQQSNNHNFTPYQVAQEGKMTEKLKILEEEFPHGEYLPI